MCWCYFPLTIRQRTEFRFIQAAWAWGNISHDAPSHPPCVDAIRRTNRWRYERLQMAQIYISSTFEDLKDYRDAVYKALRKLRHDVIAMEDYVATDKRP